MSLPDAKPAEWVELARRHGGTVDVGSRRRIRKVLLPHGAWTITLERADPSGEGNEETRFEAHMHMRHDLRMQIRRASVLDRVGRWFGMQEMTLGDATFTIRSNNESLIRSLLLDRSVSAPLLRLRRGRLSVFPLRRRLRRVPDTSVLRWTASGILKDQEQLESVVALMKGTLEGLGRIGIVRETG